MVLSVKLTWGGKNSGLGAGEGLTWPGKGTEAGGGVYVSGGGWSVTRGVGEDAADLCILCSHPRPDSAGGSLFLQTPAQGTWGVLTFLLRGALVGHAAPLSTTPPRPAPQPLMGSIQSPFQRRF